MFHTVGYDSQTKTILIASKLWSDFGSHIPLVRSFAIGGNLDRLLGFQAPEYPLFPGEPIRYHFLFYLLVGLLEKAGLPLDWALNLPSALGFTLLLWGIWSLAMALFQDKRVALLSLLFFLFNGSLAFLKFFQVHPLSLDTPLDIIRNTTFPAFGPWDGGTITAFWNLNVYTNQRHLAVAFAIGLFFMHWVAQKSQPSPTKSSKLQALNPKQIQNSNIQNSKHLGFRIWDLREAFLWGLLIGILPSFHQPTLLIFAILIPWYFLVFPHLRKSLLITALTATLLILPQLTSMYSFANVVPAPFSVTLTLFSVTPAQAGVQPTIHRIPAYAGMTIEAFRSLWYPGYLTHDQLSLQRFVNFWFQNLGLHALLIPVGFFLIPRRAKKILAPLFLLFLIANLFKFSPEVAANHKFFNFALILGNMLSAFVVISLIGRISSFIGRIGLLVGLVGFLTLSGFIDFFVILNDPKGTLPDVGNNQAATWIAANTPKDAVFLNSSFLYHPASLAGRSVFLGWPYFAWSAGYDTNTRMTEMKAMYESQDPTVFCPLMEKYNISYITIEDTHADPNLPRIDTSYFNEFSPAFTDPKTILRIFPTTTLCTSDRSS